MYADFRTSLLESLLTNPVLLMIMLMIFSIFLPWMSVQCFDNFSFTMYSPSSGVLVITAPGSGDVGSFARISLDGIEWHSFSVAKTSLNKKTGQLEIHLIIGAVGDWTKSLIQQVEKGKLPQKLWVRRVKPPGFMFSINAYSRVVVIATGAGIAPVVPHVIKHSHKLCIIWVGNNHQQTYGQEVFSLLDSQPQEIVEANKPIVQLLNCQNLWIDAFINETDANKLVIGQKAEINLILARFYQLDWNDWEISRLMNEVGGNPYLVRLAMYQTKIKNLTLRH